MALFCTLNVPVYRSICLKLYAHFLYIYTLVGGMVQQSHFSLHYLLKCRIDKYFITQQYQPWAYSISAVSWTRVAYQEGQVTVISLWDCLTSARVAYGGKAVNSYLTENHLSARCIQERAVNGYLTLWNRVFYENYLIIRKFKCLFYIYLLFLIKDSE